MRKQAGRRRPSPFWGSSHSPGDMKTSQDIQAFLASAGEAGDPLAFGWPLGEEGSSSTAGNVWWVLAGMGPPAGLRPGGEIPPTWEATMGHAYLLAVTGDTPWAS